MHINYVWVIFQKILQLIIKKAELCEYVYDFLVDYKRIDVDYM